MNVSAVHQSIVKIDVDSRAMLVPPPLSLSLSLFLVAANTRDISTRGRRRRNEKKKLTA